MTAPVLGDGDLIVTPIGMPGWLIGDGTVPDPWGQDTKWLAWADPDDEDRIYVWWEAVPTDQMIAAQTIAASIPGRHTLTRGAEDLRSSGLGFLLEREVFRPQG